MITQKSRLISNNITRLILIFLLIFSLTFIVTESLISDDNSSEASNLLIVDSSGLAILECASGTNCPTSFGNAGFTILECASGTNCPT